MAKQKVDKTNAIRILDQQKVSYQLVKTAESDEFLDAQSIAERLGVSKDQIFKTLVTKSKENEIVVAVIPSNCELDLKALAKSSGHKKIEMLLLKELTSTTGYIKGGCSPIGMKKQFPTYFAKEITAQEQVFVSAGKRGLQVCLAPTDLLKVTKGQVASITHPMS